MHAPVTLVLLAQSGDRAALEELLRIAQGPLDRYLRGLAGDAGDDVLQETLFRIARKLRWLSDARVFRAWAFRIATREAHRHLAKRRVFEPIDEEIAIVEPEAIDVEELRGAIEHLSPSSRAVIVLHYLEEMPLAEIADVLEIPLGTVKSRLGYGLAQLRERMGAA